MAEQISNINLYLRQQLQQALIQIPPLRTFIKSTFFKTVVTHTTEDIQLDIYKGKRQIAAYVNPLSQGKIVDRDGFSTYTTKPAYIKEKMAIKPTDTRWRVIGDNPYQPIDARARANQILGENLRQLDERTTRREEKMCCEAVFTGAVEVHGDNNWNASVSFGYTNTPDYTGNIKVLSGSGVVWDDANTPIIEMIDKWRMEIIKRGVEAPNVFIMDSNIFPYFLKNKQVGEYLDKLHYFVGEVRPGAVGNGVSRIATFNLPSGPVEVICYNEWYEDPDTHVITPMVPHGAVLLGSTNARCEMHYGLIQNMDCLQAVPRFPRVWDETDGSAKWIQLESAPMPNIFQTDCFTVAHVLSASALASIG